jgi:bifunctional non-homologous end joining protein LigD
MVWDVGTWKPLGDASDMLKKGNLKFLLRGKKLKGEFVLAKMKGGRRYSKGNEWLLIKKRDQYAVDGYDIDKYDYSVLTGRSLDQIARDEASVEWESNRKSAVRQKDAWLAGALAKVRGARKKTAKDKKGKSRASATSASSAVRQLPSFDLSSVPGAVRAPMPTTIRPMLATLVDKPFTDPEWLFEVKWDGYRAIAFIEAGRLRLMSRNQNDLTAEYPELSGLPKYVRAQTAILDGEIVALDEQGRPSFSLMQQRTGFREIGRRGRKNPSIPIVYYVFDLLYLDGYSLLRVDLEKRKELLASILTPTNILRYSDHFLTEGEALFRLAAERGLEGIVAKRRRSYYLQKRTREWLKIKISQRIECVIGGYTDPRGSREHFGSIVLGLYDDKGHLIHVGQAGSGFTQETHAALWKRLKELETAKNPFHNKVESTRRVHWVRPELVAEIKFKEWTHELKLRAPVFQGLRTDKKPRECIFEFARPTSKEVEKAESGEAA